MRPFTSRPAKNKKAVDAPESVPRPGMSAVWNDYDIGKVDTVSMDAAAAQEGRSRADQKKSTFFIEFIISLCR